MTVRQSRHGAATAPGLAYCYDDGGRAAGRIPGRGPDHVVRAIAICAGVDYRAVRRAMAAAMRAHGYTLNGKDSAQWGRPGEREHRPTTREVSEAVLEGYGFRQVKFHPRSRRPTLSEAHIAHEGCIVEIAVRRASSMKWHLCALVDGALRDVRDHRSYRWRGPAAGDGNRPVEVRERKALVIWVRSNPTHPIQ